MGVEIGPGSLAGALGLLGVGIAMIIPDNKWIGAFFIFAAVVVLFFDMRIGGNGVTAHFPSHKYSRLALNGMILFGVGFLLCTAWYFWPFQSQSSTVSEPSIPISISKIDIPIFELHGNFDQDRAMDTPSFLTKEVFISNTSTSNQVALKIFMLVTVDPQKAPIKIYGDGKDVWARVLGITSWNADKINRMFANMPKYLHSPIILKPQETVHGLLPFVLPFGPWGKDQKQFPYEYYYELFDSIAVKRKETHYALEIEDEVSGQSIKIDIPGKYHGH
jgi:hypothetical protein